MDTFGAAREAIFLGGANEKPEIGEIEVREHAHPPSVRFQPA